MLNRDDIFNVLRIILIEETGCDLEEISFESHLYLDLGVDSQDIVEIICRIEEELKIYLPDDIASILEAAPIDKRPPGLLERIFFKPKRIEAIETVEQHLESLEFSRSAAKRKDEIREFAKKYNVVPFSVGFLCVCVEKCLENEAIFKIEN